jgi:Ca2+-binding RTX toxin-like protein
LPDIAGNSSTTSTISVGGTVSSTLETLGDHDWFRITLTAGQSITVFLDGITLEDPYLYIRNSAGALLYQNDDISSGTNRDSRVSFTATSSGTYYIDVGAWNENYTGDYQLSVSVYTPPPLATYDQIANQLVEGYWGGDDHHFNVTQGGSITVNVTALTPAGQTLALAALQTWTDIIGVTFTPVAVGGQIVFDDNQSGAFTDGSWSGGITSSQHINISTQWLADYGTGLNSYSFQSYVHEIGHALGLGHAGNYNGSASYPYDASFQNDAWVTSIMSYFSQTENTYFAGQGFTENFVLTPMIADIIAMSTLYGLSTTTRTGNTTYGFNSSAGSPIYDASVNPGVTYTIFDSGGTDTLDYSGFGDNQLINLNAETYSNVGSEVGNVSIARGTIIENAIGGSGNDTIVGNSANNVLNGGVGSNTISYAAAAAGVTVDASNAGPQNTIGAGIDTLMNYSVLIGSDFGDTLISAPGKSLLGGNGDDHIFASSGNDALSGDTGFDTIDYSNSTAGITVTINGGPESTGGSGVDSSSGFEELIGSTFNDVLTGRSGTVIFAGAGNDLLKAYSLDTPQLYGGVGNDTYEVNASGVQIFENAGEGTDTVEANINYTLPSNIENLTLTSGAIGTGNTLDNVITGNSAANTLSGGGGNDIIIGGGGADTIAGGAGNDSITDTKAGLNGDTITDFAIGDRIILTDAALAGFTFNLTGNTLTYSGGSLTLQGPLTGQLVASAAAGGGVQLELQSSAVPTAGDDILNGTEQPDVINALGGNDTINALGSDDIIDGGAGNDTVDGGAGSDTATYASASSAVTVSLALAGSQATGGAGSDTLSNIENLTGSAFNDTLTGNAGANVFEGLGGNDLLDGAGGSDTASYANAASGVTVSLAIVGAQNTVGAGTDTLSNIENLTGSAFNDTLTGNAAANILSGDAGNDLLVGGAGADTLVGGLGNDRFFVDSADGVTELAGQGDDWVLATTDYVLGVGVSVETLSTINGDGTQPLALTGNELNQSIYGNAGNNLLSGGGGADYLVGGLGNDRFVVDQNDQISELAGQGDDWVLATTDYMLGAGVSVETLSTINGDGTQPVALTGNELNQSIYGNAGNNLLSGGGGADYLVGGLGNDRFVVDQNDQISELAGQGKDWVLATSDYALGAGVSVETLSTINGDGTQPVALTGNEFNQSIYGNAGNNLLSGGGGVDMLIGGFGNDRFVVDQNDLISELAGQGEDWVLATTDYVLGAGVSVETLSTINGDGTQPLALTGNELGQSIYGNAGANVLTSGGGADTLTGGLGNDRFVLTNAPGVATIADYANGDVVDIAQFLAVAGGTDVIAGGYVKIVGTQLQVDTSGGANSWVTIGTIAGSGGVTIRYQSGGSPTDLTIARSAGQADAMAAAVAAAGMALLPPEGQSTGDKGDGASPDPAMAAIASAPSAGTDGASLIASTDSAASPPAGGLDARAGLLSTNILGHDAPAAIADHGQPQLTPSLGSLPQASEPAVTLAATLAHGIAMPLAIPTAEQLAVAGEAAGGHHVAEVARVLLDALAGDHSSRPIDALLDALPAATNNTAAPLAAAGLELAEHAGLAGLNAFHHAFDLHIPILHPDALAAA